MLGNIVTYIKTYGDETFDQRPMSDVDALALCQFVYLKFDGLVPTLQENSPSITLEKLANHPDVDQLFKDPRYEKDNRALFEAMHKSRRFSQMGLNCYINIVEKKWETQFAAVTFTFPNQQAFIAFRGTDETIVGWKEDLNLAYMDEIPGQHYAIRYLNGVAAQISGSFYVGGHSKGGNLSVYSAMMAPKKVQDRILRIYSMDGPGLGSKTMGSDKYANIKSKIIKILPQSSMIGMLLEQDMEYSVIHSRKIGITQHDPFSWVVSGDDFLREEGLNNSAFLLDQTINSWVENLEGEERKKFLETLYEIIDSCEGDNLIDFTANMGKNLNKVLSNMKNMDEKTAQMMRRIVKSLGDAAKEHLQQEMKSSGEQLISGGAQLVESMKNGGQKWKKKIIQNDTFFSGRKE